MILKYLWLFYGELITGLKNRSRIQWCAGVKLVRVIGKEKLWLYAHLGHILETNGIGSHRTGGCNSWREDRRVPG